MTTNLPNSHKWYTWQDQQKNGAEDIFDEEYTAFRDGQVSWDLKGTCKDGALKFRGQVKAPKDKQIHEGGKDFSTVFEGEWKGAFFQNFLKLKLKPAMLDFHFDAGKKSLFDNRIKSNFWWGVHVPTKAHAMDWWQWAWKGGAISQMNCHNWNVISATACVWNPNSEKTGPGALTVEKHFTFSRNKHEVHMSTWADASPGSSWGLRNANAYRFSSDKWMMYLKHAWNFKSFKSDSTAVGGTYKFTDNCCGAYRANLNTVDNELTHSVGAEGRCFSNKLYVKTHFDLNHSVVKDSKKEVGIKWNMYMDQKVNNAFTWKWKAVMDVHNPADVKYGAVLTS